MGLLMPLKELIAQENAMSKRDYHDETVLMKAIQHSQVEVVKFLPEESSIDIDAQKPDGAFALFYAVLATPKCPTHPAASLSHPTIDVNIGLLQDASPLHCAARSNDTISTRILLEEGAVLELRSCPTSPFAVACIGSCNEVVKLMLDYGANPNFRSDHELMSPLHRAAATANNYIVNLLISRGAEVNALSQYDATPMHFAARNGLVNIMRRLFEHGVVVDSVDIWRQTPILTAVKCGALNCVKLLLEHGASAIHYNWQGQTPLHMAALVGSVSISRNLMDHGAELDSIDSKGRTPLHLTVQNYKPSIVKLLLAQGANLNVLDSEGRSPLHVASGMERVKFARPLIKFLLKKGASTELKDAEGFTALQRASGTVKVAFVGYL
ncbi:Ankyrin-1 [Agyrium rufum]|nr:Ankyrin-1 [Agyrium rufum]